MAARKAEDIIDRIVQNGKNNGYKVGRQTRNGELRIRNCIKYDLGNGYRMVCLMRENRFTVVYIGTHDECSRWIEQNKGLTYSSYDASAVKIDANEDLRQVLSKERDPSDIYEEELLKKIDDETLRTIFCGICGKDIRYDKDS